MFATYLSGFLSHSLFARLIPRWGLGVRGLVFYTSSWISIAVAIRFLDRSVEGFTIAVLIQSVEGFLSQSLFVPLIPRCSLG